MSPPMPAGQPPRLRTVPPPAAAILAATIAAMLAAMVAAAGPAAAADAEAGRRIAEQWCASCHMVEGRRSGSDAAPALAGIARDPGRGPGWVRAWLNDPHPPMPDLSLTRAEIDDVVAYLNRLAGR
ncbi:c-type cytochrome [Azospirillum thiophilum]|nr:cytochrome c [Azospirillum thiophilum]